MDHCQVAVIGLGALGSATAYHLSRRPGVSVMGFEQYALGHVRGASHDTSRILRRTYHVPEYVQLADVAYRDWHDLAAVAREQFVTRTGGLTFCPTAAPISLRDYVDSLGACDVPFEVLDAHQVRARYPQFRIPDGTDAILQEDSGIVPAARSTAVLQTLARARGAVLRAECAVLALEPQQDGVVVRTADGNVHASRVVLCADAWSNKLLAPLNASLPLSWTLEQVSYFSPPRPADFSPGAFPVWIWEDDPCFYGFPSYGEPTVKAARDVSGIPLDIDHRSFEPIPERLQELTDFLGALLPGSGEHLRTVTCQYTLTPDRDFAVGPVPGQPDIYVGLGAGHAFKFAPTIGRILADLATTGTSTEDLGLFRLDRPALVSAGALLDAVVTPGTEPLASARGTL